MRWFKPKEPEAVVLPLDLGDWEPKNLFPTEYELDALGIRLDQAREALSRTQPNTWANTYWTNTINTLVRKWKRLMIETNIGVHRNLVPETWKIRTDWFEDDYGIELPLIEFPALAEWFDRERIQHGLEMSWARHQEERYQRALTGFV